MTSLDKFGKRQNALDVRFAFTDELAGVVRSLTTPRRLITLPLSIGKVLPQNENQLACNLETFSKTNIVKPVFNLLQKITLKLLSDCTLQYISAH